MKHCKFTLVVVMAVLTLAGCKHEKKITYYEGIYSEKPVLIYIAPVDDLSARKVEKYPSDIAYNSECNTAAVYLYQTMAAPLLANGYYVVGPTASKEIAAHETRTPRELRKGDIKDYHTQYGIDAVLNCVLYRWQEKNGTWTAYLEYQLRSTKTNHDLMHKWVMATKQLPLNLKSDPYPLREDKAFARRLGGVDNGTAQRCWIVEKVNDYVLRNIPTSSTRRQFEEDLYRQATGTYIKYTWTEEGKADVQPCSLEEYEQGCFVDK